MPTSPNALIMVNATSDLLPGNAKKQKRKSSTSSKCQVAGRKEFFQMEFIDLPKMEPSV